MFTGKSPSLTCLPLARNDQPLGNSVSPVGAEPGKRTASCACSAVSESATFLFAVDSLLGASMAGLVGGSLASARGTQPTRTITTTKGQSFDTEDLPAGQARISANQQELHAAETN